MHRPSRDISAQTQLNVEIRINRAPTSGAKDVTVTNPDGQSGTPAGGFTVNP